MLKSLLWQWTYLINKMKPAKLHCWILGWFSVALCCWCTSDKFTQSDNHPHTWKKLYLAHHWPVTVCKALADLDATLATSPAPQSNSKQDKVVVHYRYSNRKKTCLPCLTEDNRPVHELSAAQ
ncbi:ribonuclease T2 [Pipra filicauda]|uniref:Ribonuclease T2 n=1 Tax=Pipra filicauda TaxID=649802 RepID=A0A7R5KD26_9PASS|nr:ribonuclease T2 [Pipra filicauda]